MNPPGWNGDFGYVQWLGIDIAVQVNGEQLPEIGRIHIRRCQNGFVRIYADSRVTVMVSEDPQKLIYLGRTVYADRICVGRSTFRVRRGRCRNSVSRKAKSAIANLPRKPEEDGQGENRYDSPK